MEKAYTAIGDFYNEEGVELIDVPENEEDIYEAISKFIDENPMGSYISDDDLKMLRAYLPAVGCDEATRDGNGGLQGKGIVTKKKSGCGVEVEATGDIAVESRWEQHHDRKQWSGVLDVQRCGGDAKVKELTFNFTYLSIGKDAEGKFRVLYSAKYERTFNDPYHLADFNNGGKASASRFDISKHIQWGFYMLVTCKLRTDEGTLRV